MLSTRDKTFQDEELYYPTFARQSISSPTQLHPFPIRHPPTPTPSSFSALICTSNHGSLLWRAPSRSALTGSTILLVDFNSHITISYYHSHITITEVEVLLLLFFFFRFPSGSITGISFSLSCSSY